MTLSKRGLAILFVLVVILHMGFFGLGAWGEAWFGDLDGDLAHAFPIHGQDSPGYVDLAHALRAGHFSFDGAEPETFRTPGYPAFIALGEILFGSLNGVIFLQALCTGGIVILTYYLGRAFFEPSVGLWAAVFFGISPSAIFHTVTLVSEIPFTFFFLLSVYALFCMRHPSHSVIAGFSLGAAALMRPIALYMLPFFLVLYGYRAWREGWTQEQLATIALCTCAFLAMIVPWQMRNAIAAGVFGFSSVSAYNVAYYNVPLFLASRFGTDSAEYAAYRAKLDAIPESLARSFVGSETVRAIAVPVLKEHTFAYAVFHITETAKFFLSSSVRYVAIHVPPFSGLQRALGLGEEAPDLLSTLRQGDVGTILHALRAQGIITLDRIFMLAVTLLALGSVLMRRVRFPAVMFLLTIGYFAILTGPVSIPRYRVPVEPLLYLLALSSAFALYARAVRLWIS